MKFTREIIKPKWEVGSLVKINWNGWERFGKVIEIQVKLKEKEEQAITYCISWCVDTSWVNEESILSTFTMDERENE